jgi:hypothetical protein
MEGNVVTNNRHGRGLTAVGGPQVTIRRNIVDGNAENGAGIYVASEANDGTGAPSQVQVDDNQVQNTGGRGKGHGQIMLYNGDGAPSNVTVRGNTVRNSKGDGFGLVVSGSMGPGINIADNNIDGPITARNGGAWNGENQTGNPALDQPIAVAPVGSSPGVGGGTGSGGEAVEETPTPQPPLPSRDDVPKVPLPKTSQRQAEANAAASRLATARQALAQATAMRLPSLSMDAIRQQIAEVNKGQKAQACGNAR